MEPFSWLKAILLLQLLMLRATCCISSSPSIHLLRDQVQAGLNTIQDTIDYDLSVDTTQEEGMLGLNATLCDILGYRSFLQYLTETQPEDINSTTLLFVTDLHLQTTCEYEKTVAMDSLSTGGNSNLTEVNCSCLSSIFQYCLTSTNGSPRDLRRTTEAQSPNQTTIITCERKHNYNISEWLMQLLSGSLPETSVQELLTNVLSVDCDISDPLNVNCVE